MQLVVRGLVCSLLILIAPMLSPLVSGQYQNIWIPPGLNFNSGSPVVQPVSGMSFGEAAAMICDANGDFLMATNGDEVWDKNYDLMPNGENLLPVPGWPNPTQSTLQGTVIVPMPGNADKYYIFSMTATTGGANSMPGYLYYSIVDINLNNGLGDVETGNKGVFIASGYIEGITAVTGNRCNIWLLARSGDDGSLHAYEITESGLNTSPVVSTMIIPGTGIGYIKAAPDRKKLLISDINYRLVDFDAASGTVSNMITVLPTGNTLLAYKVPEFSPDNTKLYAYDPVADSCYQFDLTAGSGTAIFDSRIALFEGNFSFKMGPDEKIYFSRNNGLDRINQPNLPGPACDIQTDVLSSGNFNIGWGGPNTVAVIPRDTLLTSQSHSAGCFASQTSLSAVDDTAGWDYVWNTGITGPELMADTPGIYWVSYHTPPCTYHVDTFHVRFPNGVLPTLAISAECRDDSNGRAYATTYPGDPVSYSYSWMQGTDTLSTTDTLQNVPSGSYSLYVQTNTGCDTLLFFDMPEEDYRVSFMASDTLVCLGDTIQFTNTSDNHFTTYYWDFANGDTSVLPEPTLSYGSSGMYRLLLSGKGAVCSDTAYQWLIVDQPADPSFTMDPVAVCLGQPVYFYPAVDSTAIALDWELGEQRREERFVQNRYQHAFDAAGTHAVRLHLQSRACPDTSYTDSITVYPLPEVDLGGDSSICLHGSPVYLKNLRSAPLNPHHYHWSTGDTSEVLKVVHPGTYTLSVTMEPIGCTNTESVEISKDCYVDIPNAFTPNGDGHNDYFFPRQLLSQSVSRFQMQIFNRWGQIVFETTNIDGRGWDGRFNDKVQPTGVYLYRIEVDFRNGRQEQYEGNVTLMR